MPRFHDDAIVLRRWDWSETSQIAWVFTRDHGLIRGVAKGSKRPRSAFDGGLEPLTRGEIGVISKPDADLATFTSWDLQDVCFAARASLEANRVGLFVVGLLASIVTDHDPQPRIFDELVIVLDQLGGEWPDLWFIAVRFQWAALIDTGHAPRLEAADQLLQSRAIRVLGFDPQGGEFLPDPGVHSAGMWRVRASTVRAVSAIANGHPAGPDADARLVNRFLLTYWTWILGREPRVASLLSPPVPTDT